MSSINNINLSGVQLTPKFIFGVNGEIPNNLTLIDDRKIMYLAGHNVVIYNMDDKTQYFIPGSENSSGINFITTSPTKRFLAICEKGDVKACCTIYDITNRKRKVIPENEYDNSDFSCKEFLSAQFSPKNDKQHIFTLCGEPDWTILAWQWDTFKVLRKFPIGTPDFQAMAGLTKMHYQMSIKAGATDSQIVVTGPNKFRFLQLQAGEAQGAFTTPSEDGKKEEVDTSSNTHHVDLIAGCGISSNYTCHAWTVDTEQLVVCTDMGDILLMGYDGSFKQYIDGCPRGFQIDAIHAFNRGIIVSAGPNKAFPDGVQDVGIWTYETNTQSDSYPLQCLDQGIGENVCHGPPESDNLGFDNITSLALGSTEDVLFFIAENNQLMKVNVSLDGSDIEEGGRLFQHVHEQFHSEPITGMDICLRKQLVVTCSAKYIKIWNYATKTLEVQEKLQDEPLAVAFHPSGFHIVISFNDKIVAMNVLSNSIKEFYCWSSNWKGCREIRFSNGGHYFACAINNSFIHIVNFYTSECPPNMICKALGKVRCIQWFDDDMGFAAAAVDGNVFFYDLQTAKENSGCRNTDRDFSLKGVVFTGMCLIPDRPYECLAVGSDKKMWTSDDKKCVPVPHIFSQVSIMNNGKAFFGGVGAENRPGAIEVWKMPMEKVSSTPAHGKAVERMRISHDNSFLFSCSRDGTLMVNEIKDRDPRGIGGARKFEMANFSEEILTEKTEMDGYDQQIETLQNDLNQAKDPSQGNADGMSLKDEENQLQGLNEEHTNAQLEARSKYDHRFTSKQEMEDNFERQIKTLAEGQRQEQEDSKNQYSQKMMADATAYQALTDQKKKEELAFQKTQVEAAERHTRQVNELQARHDSDMNSLRSQINELEGEIHLMKKDNEETMNQIEQDTKTEIDGIRDFGSQNKALVEDMGRKSKADLQLFKGYVQDIGSEIEKLNRQIEEKKQVFNKQQAKVLFLGDAILDQKNEIDEREKDITVKEKKILEYKKKTQELDKFKYVLDFKIQELKRDIAPREQEIMDLRVDTNKMDRSLKRYNRINANLGLVVDELKNKQQELHEINQRNRMLIRKNDSNIQGFKTAVYWVVQYIDDFDQLKRAVTNSLFKYVKDQSMKAVTVDADIKQEYENQEKFLTNSVSTLKKRLEKESQIHKEDNLNIMVDNINLIEMIKKLRTKTLESEKVLRLSKSQNAEESRRLTSTYGIEVPDLDNVSYTTGQRASPDQFNLLMNEVQKKRDTIGFFQQEIQQAMALAQQIEQQLMDN